MPVSLTCSCGRTLSIPDRFAGTTVKCPACGMDVAVPADVASDRPRVATDPALPTIMPARNAATPAEGDAARAAPAPDIAPSPELEPAHDEHAIRKEARREARKPRRGVRGRKERADERASRRKGRGDSKGREAPDPVPPRAARAQTSSPAPSPVAGPAPVMGAARGRCPSCNAPLVPNAILCTQCGAGLRSGGVMLGGEDRRIGRAILRSVGGPVAALAVIVGLVIAWQRGMFSKTPPGETPAATGVTTGVTTDVTTDDAKTPTGVAAPPEEATPPASTPDRFSGGTVLGTVDLADAGAPYDIARTVRVPAGSTLRIGPGVALRAARGVEGVELRAAGGDVVIEGSREKPVVVSIPVVVSGAKGGLSAKHAVFAGAVSVEGSGACRAEHATFLRGLGLAAKGGLETAEWRFVRCDLRPLDGKAGACLDVDIAAPSDRHKVSVTESNIRGGVKGTIGWSSRLDLGGNHWSVPPESALMGLKANGRLLLEPARSEAVAGAGASVEAVEVAMMLPAGKRRVLVNTGMGFEIAVPEGWRPAGKSMLIAPKSYRHSTKIQIEKRSGVKDAARMSDLLVTDVRRSKARNIFAGKPKKLGVAGVEGLSFECSFEIGSTRWTRRFVIVPARGHILTITLSARDEDAEALSAAFDEAVRGFRFIGPR